MNTLLLAAMLAAPVTYQYQSFTPTEDNDGKLTPTEYTCLATQLQNRTAETAPLHRLAYAREDERRSHVCVTWTVQRSETSEAFAARTEEPTGVWFSEDGLTAYWPEQLEPYCVPRGQAQPIMQCLARFATVPGAVTQAYVEQGSVTAVWEIVTRGHATYAQERHGNKARSHTKE